MLICEECQLPVGFAARSKVDKPEGKDEKWLDEHCWGCGKTEAYIEARQHTEPAAAKPEAVATRLKTVELYICPTQGCPNFYGTSTMPDLAEQFTGPKTEDATTLERGPHGSRYKHNRAECPDCRQRGEPVQRVRIRAQVKVPVEGPPTPALPQPTGELNPV